MSGHRDLRAVAASRPLLLPGYVVAEDLRTLRAWISGLPPERWSDGDEASHGWQECQLTPDEIAHVEEVIGPLRLGATEVVAWVNRYRRNTWIDAHRDASGDLQWLVAIAAPEAGAGGEIWLSSPERTVPMTEGDALLFHAAAIEHGTTPPTREDGMRISLNVRLWFTAAHRRERGPASR